MRQPKTKAEIIATYERLLAKRKAYYQRHAEARKAYQRKRYRKMMAAVKKAREAK